MFNRNRVESLSQQKKALLLESELNRLSFRAEIAGLRAAVSLWDEVPAMIGRLGPWRVLLVPLAGLLGGLVLGRRSPTGRASRSALDWIPIALAVWRRLRRRWKVDEGNREQ